MQETHQQTNSAISVRNQGTPGEQTNVECCRRKDDGDTATVLLIEIMLTMKRVPRGEWKISRAKPRKNCFFQTESTYSKRLNDNTWTIASIL